MSTFVILFVSIISILKANARVNITVGFMMPKNFALDNEVSYTTTAGSLIVAMNKAIKDGIYNPELYNITFTWGHPQCDQALSIGFAIRMIKREKASAMFGPICIPPAEINAALATYANVVMFLWSTVGAGFLDRVKYPTSVGSAGTVLGLVSSTANTLKQFNWTEVGFMYTDIDPREAENLPFCKHYAASFKDSTNTLLSEVYTSIRFINKFTVSAFQSILESLKSRARVIIVCVENREHRKNLMIAAALNKMYGPDYVYLLIQGSGKPNGFGRAPFYEPDGFKYYSKIYNFKLPIYDNIPFLTNDSFIPMLKEVAKSVLILDKYAEETDIREKVDREIVERIKGWPFYEEIPHSNASSLASYLGDSFYVYLQCLNWTYTKYGESQLKNATRVIERLVSSEFKFPSIIGNTYTVSKGFRYNRYALWSFDASSTPKIFGVAYSNINDTGVLFAPKYQSEADSIWAIRGGKRPLSTPICGFDDICPPSPLLVTGISAGSIFLFISIITFLLALIYICKKQEKARLNALWQIDFFRLVKPEDKTDSVHRSSRSLVSTMSTIPQNTTRSGSETIEYFFLDNEMVVAQKHPYHGRWSSLDEEEFRKMRTLDNERLNRFLGVSISGNVVYFLWGYCERGNLIEVIKSHSSRFDSTIILGLMGEIVEGLHYIHNSRFGQHGTLSAYNCVVGDRFNLKIQCYGSSAIKSRALRRDNNKFGLYVAPEHLQDNQNEIGSKAGDIYSFAIIASVIITMKSAFGIEDVSQTDLIEDVIYKVKAGRYPPFRPSLDDNDVDIHPEIITLIKACWSEVPSDRPKIDDIKKISSKWGGSNKSNNLMDHMFSLMENSAAELEEDVKLRTMELKDEQKKADILLYRIMPKEAADKLKIGETVTPEVFEHVSVFFSDIVSFTVLASKSTPMQIINFLNDVYTIADSVIDKHDVYKVETIGDGMHVVSGVPTRNGNNHVKEIIDMAIDFQRAVKTLRLLHLPDDKIQVRVGVHSGSCVAGIVGVTNPRYIVLGDTVNTSAKMEAAGRPGRIHITKATRDLLVQFHPNRFHIVDRGETLIKSIGPMTTYWVPLPEEISTFEP